MIIVSDTSPLCYLVLIGRVALLEQLYGRVVVPPAVVEELGHPRTPELVQTWAASPPAWLEVRSPQRIDDDLALLDPGEAAVIALARELHADALLIDERAAVRFARSEGLFVTGTLGVLIDAATAGLVSLADALAALEETSFRRSPTLFADTLRRHRGEK
jgi:predicted nucleic acid-binding protein